ncbi:MAG: hypothetical protein KA270_09295 [Saprospiraceae bacterium]|nr:hypothetical protein [Saprospiraceae bacterium]MBP6567349.1 hypothetical protein [Saprospiraceae bacterium]
MKKLIIFILGLLILSLGCSPIYYSPNAQNVPLISAKGEKNISVNAGSSNANNLFNSVSVLDLQGSYGITNRLAIQLNAGFFNVSKNERGGGGNGKLFETAIGYYVPVNEHFLFETYALFGFGNFNNIVSGPASNTINENISGSLMRYGIQPDFGYKSKDISVAVSTRLLKLNYFDISGNLTYEGENQVDYLTQNSSYLLFEPALTLRAGWQAFKIQLQLGNSYNLTNVSFRQGKTFFIAGFHLNF